MTRHDLRIAAYILAGVVALGLALGYGIGWLTRPSDPVPGEPPTVPVVFEPSAGTGRKAPVGNTVPGYADVYVNDYADLLEEAAEARVRGDLIGLYDRTGIEMTVLTIERMSNYGAWTAIEPFATKLFNTWGIGNALRNDGVLVLVARYDRHMRIELGSGYGRSRDDDMKRVIEDVFVPQFKNDAYQRGIEAGVAEIILELTGSLPGGYDSGVFKRGLRTIGHWLGQFGAWIWGLLSVPLGGGALWLRRYRRNRPRACGQCGTTMERAGEAADDEHLDGGQRLEEYLESVDYDVWHCPDCGHMDIRRYAALFSGHGSCPSCSYRTLKTTSTVLVSATTSRSGKKRLDYHCRHCDHTDSEIRTIPKKSSSSSSGSGRSSFGGGSSSGGGASGSW